MPKPKTNKDPFDIPGLKWHQWKGCRTVDQEGRVTRIGNNAVMAWALVKLDSEIGNALRELTSTARLLFPIQFGPKQPSDDGSIKTVTPPGMWALILRGKCATDIERALNMLRDELNRVVASIGLRSNRTTSVTIA